MWDDYPFSESNKITKRTVGVEFGGDGKGGGGWKKVEKEGGGYAIYGEGGGFKN